MAGNRLTIAYIVDGHLNVTVPEMVALDRRQIYDLIGKRIFENANRRVRNIRAKKLMSESVYDVMHSGGLFSAKGKTKEQLIDEIRRADNFLKQLDSTVKGAQRLTRNIADIQPNLTPGERNVVYDIYRSLESTNPIYFAELRKKNGLYGDSDKLMRQIEQVVYKKRVDYPQGLAGDLLSRDKKKIAATYAAREKAITEIKLFFQKQFSQAETQIVKSSGKSFEMNYEESMEMLRSHSRGKKQGAIEVVRA